MKSKVVSMIALWFFCCFLFAAESEVRVDTVLVDTSTVSFPVKRESKLKRTYNWLMDKMVRYDVSKLDTNYVNVPNKHWSVVLSSYHAGLDLNIKTPKIQASEMLSQTLGGVIPVGYDMGILELDAHSGLKSQVGINIGYDCASIGYTFNVANGFSVDLSIGLDMGSFGFEGRLHRTKRMKGTIRLEGREQLEQRFHEYAMGLSDEERAVVLPQLHQAQQTLNELGSIDRGDLDVSSYLLNLYYVFSPRRYSYRAAFKTDMIQRRSAGSWQLSGIVFHSRVNLHKEIMVQTMQGLNQFSSTMFALGGGYGYNHVTDEGRLMLHGSLMPMLMIALKGNVKSRNTMTEEQHDYLDRVSDQYLGGTRNVSLTGVARASANYNISRYFMFGLDGVFNLIRLGHKPNYQMLADDWVIHTYIGVRF
jgi:hypothetical protein